MSKTANPRDVLLKPVISEKSYRLADDGKYTFIVAPGSNKTQIRQAVEAVFRVKVTGVNTVNRPGKRRRTRFGWGKRVDTKRAIVTLAEGGAPVAADSTASASLVRGASLSTNEETTKTRSLAARSDSAPRSAAAFIFLGVFWV